MDIERALPSPELRSVVRSFEERRADLGSAVLAWPVAARPHQVLDIHLAEPYRVRLNGGPAWLLPETIVVGPQTYRRAHLYLSGRIHVFNILFQPVGFHRLVGIDMTSLVNEDPIASDVLGPSAVTLGDAVRGATDFKSRVAAAERWLGTKLDGRDNDEPIGHASRLLIATRGCARIDDLVGRSGLRPPVSAPLCEASWDDAKVVCANHPIRPGAGGPSRRPDEALDRHRPRTRLFRSGPFHP
jgi:hypothetical protein